ncbi:glycine-rich protein 5-like [Pistacia vera]|uniref:glycine-rich protein 5-like n=1 Tax=Pistacia vera TaxID=55513 RepID=UPI0012639C22|nr:glycine-rich protein 5-like [Pistacia vera]
MIFPRTKAPELAGVSGIVIPPGDGLDSGGGGGVGLMDDVGLISGVGEGGLMDDVGLVSGVGEGGLMDDVGLVSGVGGLISGDTGELVGVIEGGEETGGGVAGGEAFGDGGIDIVVDGAGAGA